MTTEKLAEIYKRVCEINGGPIEWTENALTCRIEAREGWITRSSSTGWKDPLTNHEARALMTQWARDEAARRTKIITDHIDSGNLIIGGKDEVLAQNQIAIKGISAILRDLDALREESQ